MRSHAPQRWSTASLRAIGYYVDDGVEVARLVLARIIRNRQQTEAGSFVLANPYDNAVYVLAEGSSNTTRLLRVHAAWWVGQYAQGATPARPAVFQFPQLQHILDDFDAHFGQHA